MAVDDYTRSVCRNLGDGNLRSTTVTYSLKTNCPAGQGERIGLEHVVSAQSEFDLELRATPLSVAG